MVQTLTPALRLGSEVSEGFYLFIYFSDLFILALGCVADPHVEVPGQLQEPVLSFCPVGFRD